MAQAGFESAGSAPHLNSNEQDLLLNALKSNQPENKKPSSDSILNSDASHFQGQNDASLFESLNDASFFDGHFDTNTFNWDLDPTSITDGNNDNPQDSSNSADGEDSLQNDQPGDKRKERGDDTPKSPDGNKRRDSEEKSAKKPGRKPLTSEPTSKRKAQNRAAQRAFRERKEKHLHDLEQKVQDLEKASEATNHENGVLRAQVDRLQAEVAEYKKKIGTSRPSYSPSQPINKINWDIGQNFDFEFPKFGVDDGASQKVSESANAMSWNNASPLSNARSMSTSTGISTYFDSTQSPLGLNKVRSPTVSTDKSVSTSESPLSFGLGSSVCTTPEATVDSPGQYKSSEKKMSLSHSDFRASTSPSQPKTPAQDAVPGLDWFASQNNNLFDPILIDAYRDPQDKILNNADLNLSFFDDAFPWNPASNFSAPFPATNQHDMGMQSKKTLMDQVEKAAEGKQHDHFTNVVDFQDDKPRQITCAKLWDRVQRSEKVLNGEADMDDLCLQLKAKAKCGGPNKGAVVDEKDVDAILGPDPAKKKNTGMYGMFSS